jgi:hypothetical protein
VEELPVDKIDGKPILPFDQLDKLADKTSRSATPDQTSW